MMKSHILGFPRIGAARELKKAVEEFWAGNITEEHLHNTAGDLKRRHWEIQNKAGLSYVTVGDFSFYDHMLDTSAMLGLVPPRYTYDGDDIGTKLYFQMARGDVAEKLHAMEMTKWFDANYHYIVPEFQQENRIRLHSAKIMTEVNQAVRAGYKPKAVIPGPVTFVALGKEFKGFDRWKLLPDICEAYRCLISELADLCEIIQIDEPILCTDLEDKARSAFVHSLSGLKEAAGASKLMLATYFGELGDNLDLALQSKCDILHLDLVRGGQQLDRVLEALPGNMSLSAGIVDGRNIWRNDLSASQNVLEHIAGKIGKGRLMAATSCSLLHSPVDLELEDKLDPELKSWMAFAVQKCRETALLAQIMDEEDVDDELAANTAALKSRKESSRTFRKEIRKRCESVTEAMLSRKSPYQERCKAQKWLGLPFFPTTTIGSFPQTPEIRSTRRKFKNGGISAQEYKHFMQQEICNVVKVQEDLDLDVFVHGEPERNDMVEYFGEQLEGFCFSSNGWVQSYGSRCVKPPIIYGDVSRPNPMTVKWITYAQEQTKRPMKGMLTGPVTILCWSFVRDDLPREEVCRQIALAVRDEVSDLEKAGIKVIQIDEAALREGMPLRSSERDNYLRWAVDSFRLTASGVEDNTQIHTHMCYSEFNAIIRWIAAMDADVISVESSRSKMELLDAFREFEYPNEIGPGVYDIHSPRIPDEAEMLELLEKALKVVPKERLWVNPDCGLKTRGWPETMASLRNMVAAAKKLRERHS